MVTYKTPGVYVRELSVLPPSVAEVSTAIPAFIGYTNLAEPTVARIDTLLEYESMFGSAPLSKFKVKTRTNSTTNFPEIVSVERTKESGSPDFLMYYSLSMYFKNGGGSCYIISIGKYGASVAKSDFEWGLSQLEKEDEPTLIVLADASNLSPVDYYDVCTQVLGQCDKLRDRFAIFDVLSGNVDAFRNGIGQNYLKYGAAYHPYLKTSLSYAFTPSDIEIEIEGASTTSTWTKTIGGISVSYIGTAGDNPSVTVAGGSGDVTFEINPATVLSISKVAGKDGNAVLTAWTTWIATNDARGFVLTVAGTGSDNLPTGTSTLDLMPTPKETLKSIETSKTALYNLIKSRLVEERLILPPSCAIAGIYASVDRNRGVWKTPANVSVAGVIEPVSKITSDQQENLNIDPTGGKSINVIRQFTGKGTLVWGGRTLAGNDNEWRYVSVRRLFNLIEESTQKSTAFAVFEPNDTTTWLKVKAMIESYLYGLWQLGALMGATQEQAYFVNVGLGKTMTPQDVLEGRMIVEIGIAAVRPAEFIILTFMHKLPEA